MKLSNNYIVAEQKLKNSAAPIVWFIAICVAIYAFYCVSKGFSFGVALAPFRVGCWK